MTAIRVHEFVENVCKWCGAKGTDTECSCITRYIEGQAELCPEPTLRRMSCEDFDAIWLHLRRLTDERENPLQVLEAGTGESY